MRPIFVSSFCAIRTTNARRRKRATNNKKKTLKMDSSELLSTMGLLNNKHDMSSYEQTMLMEKMSRRPSGTGIAGLVLGTVGAAVGIGAWIFAPVFANAKANGVKDLANAQFAANNQQISALANLLGTERAERVAQGVTLTQTVNDTVSGQQASTLTAQQAAELSAVNSVMQQTFADAVTGRSSLNPTPVNIYSAPQPCSCPNSCGCGNN